MRYCIGVSYARHSVSVRWTLVLLKPKTALEGRPQAETSPGFQSRASLAARVVVDFMSVAARKQADISSRCARAR
jgi:hypothetical protein